MTGWPSCIYYLKRDLSGYGPLDPLMQDPCLEDLSCNGNDLPVFIFHRDYGSLPTSVIFREDELNQFVLKLAQKANKQISLSNPMVDATLPDGARVQITYSDVVSLRGSSFTIRKFRAEPMTPLDLIRFGTYNAETLAFLWLAIEHRKSLLVVGGTASGKTSTMNAVSLFIPQNAKVVSLEDTREIQLPHRNWLPTQTREGNTARGQRRHRSLLPPQSLHAAAPGIYYRRGSQGRGSPDPLPGNEHRPCDPLDYPCRERAGSDQPPHPRPDQRPAGDVPRSTLSWSSRSTLSGRHGSGAAFPSTKLKSQRTGRSTPSCSMNGISSTTRSRRMSERSRVLEEIAFHCGWDYEELEHQLKKREEFFSWALEVEPPALRDLANAIHDLGD